MDAQSMVRLLQAAGPSRSSVLAGFYAETVKLTHAPPSPTDGEVPREQLIAGSAAEAKLFSQIMPDYKQTNSYVAEDADRIVETMRMQGSIPGQGVIDFVVTLTHLVRDGRITEVTAAFDPAQTALLKAALTKQLKPGGA